MPVRPISGRNTICLLGAVSLFVFTGGLAGCTSETPEAPGNILPAAQPVVTEVVQWQPRKVRIEAVGTSRALKSVTVHPEVSGEVVEVPFSAGDKVKSGQTIVRLDDRDQRLAVKIARIELEDAKRLLSRYERTRGSGTVTESVLDDARSAVERARLNLDRAQVALDYRTVQAPFDGYLGISTVDSGARVDTTTVITTIDDRSRLLVTFQVPELFLGQIEQGQSIAVSTWSNGSPDHTGQLVEIDSRINPETRTFAARALVENDRDILRPGMSFRVSLDLEAGRYPLIPEVALQWGNDGAFVWGVNESGKVARIPATIVQRVQGAILVESDLPEGLQVVTEGTQRMREGLSVTSIAGLQRDAGL